MKIVLAVDGSEHTRRMLSYIAAHDDLLGSGHDYTLLTVIPQMPVYATQFIEPAMLDSYYKERAEDVFKSLRTFAAQSGWKVSTAHEIGPVAQSIAEHARVHHSDLIVMGTHGHGALANAVMGSVAAGVLAHSKTPVLLIR